MIVSDWRVAGVEAVSRLYAGETLRWRRDLHWDIAAQWPMVEVARTNGQLPGCIALSSAGEVLGWSFQVVYRDALQVGALVSDSPATTERLLDAIMTSGEARAAHSIMMFGYFEAPGLDACLGRYGLALERYRYLQKALGAEAREPAIARTYDHANATAVTSLLAASYEAIDPLRPFAKTGHRDEWVEYVTQLTVANGCGVFEPAMSPVSPFEWGGLEAAALVTRISPAVAHLAQVAVHPVVRGRSLGRQLVTSAMGLAKGHGCDRVTLLVSEKNARAAALYARMGFAEGAAFASVGRAD
jgi:ribosomal protein S18 acetylase RimI-like enzyme